MSTILSDNVTLPETSLLSNSDINLATLDNDPTNDQNTLTFTAAGTISGSFDVFPADPFVRGFIQSEIEELLDLAPNTIPNTVNFSETFTNQTITVPSDYLERAADGDITLDLPLLSQLFILEPTTPIEDVLDEFFDPTTRLGDLLDDTLDEFGITIPDGIQNELLTLSNALEIANLEDTVDFINDFLVLEIEGIGTLETVAGTTDFEFEFVNETTSLVVDNFDPEIFTSSPEGESTLTVDADFSLGLVLDEFQEILTAPGLPELLDDLPELGSVISSSELDQLNGLIDTYQLFTGEDEFTLASGSFNFNIDYTPLTT